MKKSLLKNTFVRTTFLMLMSALVLTSCKKDNTEPSPASGTDFKIPVCNPIITEGCDPLNHVIDTMNFPYIDIDELIGGGPEKSQIKPHFWADAGCWILDKAGGGLLGGVFSALSSTLTTAIIGPDETQQKLDDILDQLSTIETNISTLMSSTNNALLLLDGDHYTGLHDYYTSFQSLLTGLTTENQICETNLKHIYDNLQNYSEEQLNAAVANVMRTWGDRPIDGYSAYGAFNQLYNKLVDSGPMYYGALRNIFSVYDVIVFHNTPWEKTGYDMRDMFRAAVAAEAVRTAWLTALYYRTAMPDSFQTFTNDLKTKLENLYEIFASSSNSVNRRYDKVVCQLSNALFILNADALEEHKGWSYNGNSWYRLDGTKHVFSQGDITSDDVSAAHNSQLTNSQIRQITAYYEPKYGRDYTILNCLEDGGLIVPSYYHTIFTYGNGGPYNIQHYEEVYLLSQETTMKIYIGFMLNMINRSVNTDDNRRVFCALLRLSGLYNVGIPLSCTDAAGFSCHGYLPDFHKDYIYEGGYNDDCKLLEDDLTLSDDSYFYFRDIIDACEHDLTEEEIAIIINKELIYEFLATRWHVIKGYTYTFPGKYVLWFKTGSLQLYDKFSFDI